jgi:hypothetical protein
MPVFVVSWTGNIRDLTSHILVIVIKPTQAPTALYIKSKRSTEYLKNHVNSRPLHGLITPKSTIFASDKTQTAHGVIPIAIGMVDTRSKQNNAAHVVKLVDTPS